MAMSQTFAFFGGVCEYPFGFVAEPEVDARWNADGFPSPGGALLVDGFLGAGGQQYAIRLCSRKMPRRIGSVSIYGYRSDWFCLWRRR